MGRACASACLGIFCGSVGFSCAFRGPAAAFGALWGFRVSVGFRVGIGFCLGSVETVEVTGGFVGGLGSGVREVV